MHRFAFGCASMAVLASGTNVNVNIETDAEAQLDLQLELELGCGKGALTQEALEQMGAKPLMDGLELLKEGKTVASEVKNGLRAVCKKIKEEEAKKPTSCWLKTVGRGVGKIPSECPAG